MSRVCPSLCAFGRPLCRMVVGMTLAASSFFSAGLLNVAIDVSRPLVYTPSSWHGTLMSENKRLTTNYKVVYLHI